jgi:Flp pilus assembly protein TadG
MKTLKRQTAQATVLTLIFLTVLLGMAALVLDVGAWYRADRDTQNTADAAALAAAQALPDDTGQAASLAMQYANRNGGGLDAGDISFSTGSLPNDTVTVQVKRSAGGIFTRLFGLSSVNVGSKASARAGVLAQAQYVAPITVNLLHPALHCGGTQQRPVPCFGQPTEIDLLDLHSPGSGNAAGSFGLINLTGDSTGSVGSDELSNWMDVGYDKMMPLGTYYAVPSSKFNDSQFLNALDDRVGDDVLFPIYDTLEDPGSNARFNVVGWIAFHITDYNAHGSSGWVKGWFTKVIWRGIQNPPNSPQPPNFGARTIELID